MVFSLTDLRATVACAAAMALSATCLAAHPAAASSYTFDVLYSGGGSAALAPGSDDPLTTTMVEGDSFTYTLAATGGGEWRTLQSTSIFPFFALSVAESGTRVGDFTLKLEQNGVSVFSYSENGASNSFAHLGTNTVSFPSGLIFNAWVLTDTNTSMTTTSTPLSLLPWPGKAPEAYSPEAIAYSAVPELSTWAMALLGFAGLGCAAMRRAGRPVAAEA